MIFIPMLVHWSGIIFTAFLIVTAVQLFYYGCFFSRLAFYRPEPKQQSQQHPVSVIICARDEEENLADNLPEILTQEYQTTHEVLLINDNSIDHTKYILAELQKTFKKLQVIELTQEAKLIKGKKYPLTVGIKEARYGIVLLTDADCKPASQQWLLKMQDAFTPGIEVVLGYGAYYKMPGFLNKVIRFETLHTAMQYLSFALAGMPYMGVGRNLSYRKDLFFKNKGFSVLKDVQSGDDDLFINQVATKENTAIVIDLEAFTFSKPKENWAAWKHQKMRHYTTGKYYKPVHKFLLGLYAITQFLFYPLFIASLLSFDWRWSLILLAIRWGTQGFILKKVMHKLGESDLFSSFILFDMFMAVYYIMFAPALWKRPEKNWN